MAQAFAEITFTPAVKAAQERFGSRESYSAFEAPDAPRGDRLTAREREFIEERDGFYQATVNADGWPYVQFRGGPAGFLRVVDAQTLAFADFRGNRQYLSVGNLAGNDRIALILMDYANRRRLKLWGRVTVVDTAEDPSLIERVQMEGYNAVVERAFVISVEAFDWNCPQHITPRFTDAEIEVMLRPVKERFQTLVGENERLRAHAAAPAGPLGRGPQPLVVTGVRQLTPRIRAYELRATHGGELPEVQAGAHLPVPVRLADGAEAIRTYSIASDPARRDVYEIAVLREDEGRGGSLGVHRDYQLGQVLHAGTPVNGFALHTDPRPAVLLAGGVGITPLKAMAHMLSANGRAFQLHYAARSAADVAYGGELRALAGDALTVYADGDRLDVRRVLAEAPDDAVFYACGPGRLIDAVVVAGSALGIDLARIRFERFAAPSPRADDRPVEVRLRKSGKTLLVPADTSVLDAMLDAGIDQPFSCKTGTCGTCAVPVLEGVPDHRDTALAPADHAVGLMCTCVSRACSTALVLDA